MIKLTYEFIVSVFEKEGYKVLTKKEDYKNTKTRLQIICPDGEYWEANYINLITIPYWDYKKHRKNIK